ncbi:hypothetical protein OIU77_003550 [Salix suchowensis]|uniref:GYF domain-containing protein n=1 Tax=Salix suchowensis TaxID=1278906 RepID=A0ABQ9B1V1_9ROSI|nr:hypothetical protein OIU77_003550 [Salix suchowensis]
MVHERVTKSMQTQGGEQTGLNSQNASKNWVASTGSMTDDWKSQSIVQCGSYSGVVSLNLPPPQLVDDMETDKLWHYQDPTGKTQGPFAMAQLRKWSTSGLFPQDLRVWKINEKPNDSILLTDVLVGRFHKEPALPDNSYLLAQEAIAASDKDKRHGFDLHQSTDGSLLDKKNMDHWKSVQNDASVNCNDNEALLKKAMHCAPILQVGLQVQMPSFLTMDRLNLLYNSWNCPRAASLGLINLRCAVHFPHFHLLESLVKLHHLRERKNMRMKNRVMI